MDLPRLPDRTPAATPGTSAEHARPGLLYDAIRAGRGTDHGRDGTVEEYPFTLRDLGLLPLPDGRLVGCDPYLAEEDQPPYLRTVRPGAHRVFAVVATIAEDHLRNAAALLVDESVPGPVVRWEVGRTSGDAADGAVVGYGVDAGAGCLASPAGLPALVAVLSEDDGELEDPMSRGLWDTGTGSCLVTAHSDAPPVAAFSSGWGDGHYPTWFGLDARGAVAVVMTDFFLLSDPEPAPPAGEAPANAPAGAAPAGPIAKVRSWFGRR